jgi:hypothetical protein
MREKKNRRKNRIRCIKAATQPLYEVHNIEIKEITYFVFESIIFFKWLHRFATLFLVALFS